MLILPKLEAPQPPLLAEGNEYNIATINSYVHTLVDYLYNCNAPLADSILGQSLGSAKYNEGSFTYTLTGFTSAITGTAYYAQVGKMVNVAFAIQVSGISNATTFTITGVPTAIDPFVSGTCIPLATFDNGIPTAGMIQINTGGTWNVYSNYATGTWTALGVKGIQVPSFTYMSI